MCVDSTHVRFCRPWALATVLCATAPASAATFAPVGVPIREAGILGKTLGPDASGKINTLYVSFNQQGGRLFLLAVNLDTDKWKQFLAPVSEPGAWGICTGSNGRIYLGTYYQAHVLEFDPKAQKLRDLGRPIASETYIWRLASHENGKIYGGTYPGARLFAYDPATEKFEACGQFVTDDKYAHNVVIDADGIVYVGIGSVNPRVGMYDPKSGTMQTFDLPGVSGKAKGFAALTRCRDGVYARAGSETFRMSAGGPVAVQRVPAAVPALTLPDGRKVTTVATYTTSMRGMALVAGTVYAAANRQLVRCRLTR